MMKKVAISLFLSATCLCFLPQKVQGDETQPIVVKASEKVTTVTAKKSWKSSGNAWYLVDEKGVKHQGWYQENNTWYYLNPKDKKMVTGLQVINGVSYYFKNNGAMITGWHQMGENWIFGKSNGELAKGWLLDHEVWYYLNPKTFQTEKGLHVINGQGYYFKNNAAMIKGWYKVGNGWVYGMPNGALKSGWFKEGNVWYYLFPDTFQTAIGVATIQKTGYYFAPNGVMRTGWQKIGNQWLHAKPNGALTTGWFSYGNKWYYLDENSYLTPVGIQKIGKTTYGFSNDGAMLTGWQKLAKGKFFARPDGVVLTGWFKDNNIWYYGDLETALVKTGIQKIGKETYYLDAEGKMKSGWFTINNQRYFANTSGHLKTGWQFIDGAWYYFKDFVMQTGWLKEGNNKYYLGTDGKMFVGIHQIGSFISEFNKSGVWLGYRTTLTKPAPPKNPVNMDQAIEHMRTLKKKKIKYSMTGSRTGEDGTGDCSGTVYASILKGGAVKAGWAVNTETMHTWLLDNEFKNIATNEEWNAKKGDVVIFGEKGASGGSNGHVVIFTSETTVIHCTYKNGKENGIYEEKEDYACPYDYGWYVYRLGK